MLRIPIALLVVVLLPILMPTPASATERPVASIRARGEFVTIASVEATGCLEVFLQALRQENRLNLGESIFLFYEVWDHCTPAPDGSSATRIARGFGSVPVDSTALALDVRKNRARLTLEIPTAPFESVGLTGPIALTWTRLSSPRTAVRHITFTDEESCITFRSHGSSTFETAVVSGTLFGIVLDGAVGEIGLNSSLNVIVSTKCDPVGP
jgi:hypothetical protein